MPTYDRVYRRAYRRRTFPANHAYDVIICMDTTGSMGPVITAVKEAARNMITELLQKMESINIGVS